MLRTSWCLRSASCRILEISIMRFPVLIYRIHIPH
jgi:hypothetical protein